jgi:hypothetical protein
MDHNGNDGSVILNGVKDLLLMKSIPGDSSQAQNDSHVILNGSEGSPGHEADSGRFFVALRMTVESS